MECLKRRGRKARMCMAVLAVSYAIGVSCVEAGDGLFPAVFADAVCWWKLDVATAGALQASQVVDAKSGINGRSIVGTAPLSWVATPSAGPQGASIDGSGITMVQSNHITMGTSGVSNKLYGVSRDATIFMRLKLANYANNGQGIKFIETFRWVGGPPNRSQGLTVSIFTSATPSLNGKIQLIWGSEQNGYVATDPNHNILNGIAVKKMPTNEWVDLFAIWEPGTNVRIHVNAPDGFFTNSYSSVQNGAAGSAATNWLASVTAGFTTANLGGGNSSFNGVLESAAVWNRVLTTDEIHTISTYVAPQGTVILLH